MDSPFRLINLKHQDGPPLKFSIFISVATVLAFSRICTVETPRPSALCVFAQSSRKSSSSGHLLLLPLTAFFDFLHWDSYSRWCLQRLTIDSLMLRLRAAALFPSFTSRLTAFNLKAASYAFLRLFSIMRVCAWKLPLHKMSRSRNVCLSCSRSVSRTTLGSTFTFARYLSHSFPASSFSCWSPPLKGGGRGRVIEPIELKLVYCNL